MATVYTEIPHNFEQICSMFEMDIRQIIRIAFTSEKLFFYDTCSFRTHSNLSENGMRRMTEYFKKKKSAVILTRCILMELASVEGIVKEEYTRYLHFLTDKGISALLLDEEMLFDLLSECFSTNAKVNEYLTWAVRMSKSPVSTITETLKRDTKLAEEILEGKNPNRADKYRRFFSAVRKNKEPDDNLGEELLGICVHILSHLPGTRDGKLCVLTDDKGAAAKIDTFMRRTNAQYRGAKIILFSTPKLVQHMYQENRELTEEDLVELLSRGIPGNVAVMGTTAYDLSVNLKISMSCEALAKKIMESNGIHIVF